MDIFLISNYDVYKTTFYLKGKQLCPSVSTANKNDFIDNMCTSNARQRMLITLKDTSEVFLLWYGYGNDPHRPQEVVVSERFGTSVCHLLASPRACISSVFLFNIYNIHVC